MKRLSLVMILLIVVVVLVVAAACARPEPPPAPTPTPTPTPTPSAIDANELYATNCAACHGENRQGVSGLGDAMIPEHLAHDSDAEIKETILDGIPDTAMPGFQDRLSSEEIDALLQLIKYTSP